MDYQKIPGDILFGADVLDNTARGNFIKAVTFDALTRHDRLHNVSKRWHHTGLGWGPWDLQRGAETLVLELQVLHWLDLVHLQTALLTCQR